MPGRQGKGARDNPRAGIDNAIQTLLWVQGFDMPVMDITRVDEALRQLCLCEVGKEAQA